MNFVFDIDGTISFDGYHVDQRIEERIFKLQQLGHQVIFASARQLEICYQLYQNLKILHLLVVMAQSFLKMDRLK